MVLETLRSIQDQKVEFEAWLVRDAPHGNLPPYKITTKQRIKTFNSGTAVWFLLELRFRFRMYEVGDAFCLHSWRVCVYVCVCVCALHLLTWLPGRGVSSLLCVMSFSFSRSLLLSFSPSLLSLTLSHTLSLSLSLPCVFCLLHLSWRSCGSSPAMWCDRPHPGAASRGWLAAKEQHTHTQVWHGTQTRAPTSTHTQA